MCSILITRATGEMSQAAVNMDAAVLTRFLIFITGITGVKAVTAAVRAYLTERYSGNVGYRFRDSFVRHFINLPFSGLEKKNSGEMLSVYSNDVPQAAAFVSNSLLSIIRDIITVLATFIFLLMLNPLFTILYYCSFPLLAFMQIKASTPLQKKSRKTSQETAKFNAVVNDCLQNTSTVAAYSLEEIMEKRYLSAYDNYFDAMKEHIFALAKLVCGGFVISGLPALIVIAAAGLSVVNGDMSLAGFVAYSTMAITPISVLMNLAEMLGNTRVHMAGTVRFNENTDAELQDIHKGVKIDGANTSIKFDGVCFSYGGSGSTSALDNVSFEIKPGDRVAFVGGSGSGKSTIIKLLLGLYEPQAGSIFVSDQNINMISKHDLRKQFSYVPQDNFMFPESIGENISCVIPEAKDNRKLEDACRNAGILDFINSLPSKFDTVLSEAAENVSGGQRQRIAIARAFYKDAPVVLFDEATSALDPVTEGEVLKTMETLIEGRTVLVVAHRIKAIDACNKIIVMERGRIAGIGSHEQLIKDSEVYASLYESLTKAGRNRLEETIHA